MNESIKTALFLIAELKINEISHQSIESVVNNQPLEDYDSIKPSIQRIFEEPDKYEKLLNCIRNIRDKGYNSMFWREMVNNNLDHRLFLPLCIKLMPKSGKIAKITCLIYSTLLGMPPIHYNYNATLMQILLKLMVTVSQAVESKSGFSEKVINSISIAADVFDELSYVFGHEFLSIASAEVVTAFVEIAFKIGPCINKEVNRYGPKMGSSIVKFIQASFLLSVDLVLPYMVSTLISENIVRTAYSSKFKKEILDISMGMLKDHDSKLLLVIKHLIVRCLEKQAVRESVAHDVCEMGDLLIEKRPMFDFIFKCCRSPKIIIRIMACEVLKSAFYKTNFLTDEYSNEIFVYAFQLANDNSPTVRGAAMGVLASVSEKKDMLYNGDNYDNFKNILRERLRDEKLVVRRAAMKLLNGVMSVSNEHNTELFELLAERTYDRSFYIRQEALTCLSEYFNKYPTEEIFTTWLDCVLMRAIDPDHKTEEIAHSLIEKYLLGNIERLAILSSSITSDHISVLRKIFRAMDSNNHSLVPFGKVLTKYLRNDDLSSNLWCIADALSGALNKTFIAHKLLVDFWPKRMILHYSFLSIVSRSTILKDWSNEALDTIQNISKGKVITDYGRIKYLVIIAKSHESYENIFSDVSIECIKNISLDDIVQNGGDEIATCRLFLLGEIIYNLKTKSFDPSEIINIAFSKTCPQYFRSIAMITLGKACLIHYELAKLVVIKIIEDFANDTPDEVKMNQITLLSDLCVSKTSIIDQFAENEILKCMITCSKRVRHHAIIIITRLIAEDYFKLIPLTFFKFMSLLVSNDIGISRFASYCLFDVLVPKNPKILSSFPESLGFFNENKSAEFSIPLDRKREMYFYVLDHMSDVQLLDTIQQLIRKYIDPFISKKDSLVSHIPFISDVIGVIGYAYQHISTSVITTESSGDAELEASKKVIGYVNIQMSRKTIPSLVRLNKILKRNNSSLQTELRKVMALISSKDTSLVEVIRSHDQLLANEIEDIADSGNLIANETIVPSPIIRRMFSSSLLSKIADKRSGNQPLLSQAISTDDIPIFEKRPPSVFNPQD